MVHLRLQFQIQSNLPVAEELKVSVHAFLFYGVCERLKWKLFEVVEKWISEEGEVGWNCLQSCENLAKKLRQYYAIIGNIRILH